MRLKVLCFRQRPLVVVLASALLLALSGFAHAQTAPAPPAPAASDRVWRWTVTNLTRVEAWKFFEPPPTGGDPDYAFVGNRLRLGVNGTWPRIVLDGSVQYVQFSGLPDRSIGPGPLGTGALYFDHSGSEESRGVYLRTLNVRARVTRGVTIQAGRFGYTSGAESPSGSAKVVWPLPP